MYITYHICVGNIDMLDLLQLSIMLLRPCNLSVSVLQAAADTLGWLYLLIPRYSGVACKKVYFLWITQSHRQFEWFIDVLREVEKKDVTNVLEMHIFITQFFHKFDLRTTMLVKKYECGVRDGNKKNNPKYFQYICENHFQRLSKRSLFTGLKASNHFGRPDMSAFLSFVQRKHSYVSVTPL